MWVLGQEVQCQFDWIHSMITFHSANKFKNQDVHYIGGVVLRWELQLAIVQHVMSICVSIVTKCSTKTQISHSQKSHLLISLIDKLFFLTYTLSNLYCKLTIYAVSSFIISFEIWDMSADVAIVGVFLLYFTSIFAISRVLRRFE